MLRVFVYGSLRAGLHNDINVMASKIGASIDFKGTDTVRAEIRSLGSFPYISRIGVETENTVDVLGEVYEISSGVDRMFGFLDALEGYPRFYNRKKIRTEYGDAWVYFIDQPNEVDVLVPSGDWKTYLDSFNEQAF